MRILHVWDQAGVAGCIAKYQRKLGYTAHVVKIDGLDSLLIDDYYQTEKILKLRPKNHLQSPSSNPSQSAGKVKESASKMLIQKIKIIGYKPIYAVRMLRFANTIRKKSKDYDIVHIHSSLLCALFLPFKPKIIEFHGDDIRSFPTMAWKGKIKFRQFIAWLLSKRTRCYASTPDTLNDHPWMDGYIRNPVDTDLFTRKKAYKPNTALFYEKWYEDATEAKEIAQKLGLQLTALNRATLEHRLDFKDASSFYEQFEYFIDQNNTLSPYISNLSKTALECLALGTKVIAANTSPLQTERPLLKSLPKAHYPEQVAKMTLQIYEEVLTNKKRNRKTLAEESELQSA